MKRHGLALLIAHYRKWGYNFLHRYELNNGRFGGYYFDKDSPRPSDITQAVCYRYLRMKKSLTVENWNRLIEVVSVRVSGKHGSSSVIRCLKVACRKQTRNVLLSEFGQVIPSGRRFSNSRVLDRLERFKSFLRERHSKNAILAQKEVIKQYKKLFKLKAELSEVRQLTSQIRKASNGKHNEIYSRNFGKST